MNINESIKRLTTVFGRNLSTNELAIVARLNEIKSDDERRKVINDAAFVSTCKTALDECFKPVKTEPEKTWTSINDYMKTSPIRPKPNSHDGFKLITPKKLFYPSKVPNYILDAIDNVKSKKSMIPGNRATIFHILHEGRLFYTSWCNNKDTGCERMDKCWFAHNETCLTKGCSIYDESCVKDLKTLIAFCNGDQGKCNKIADAIFDVHNLSVISDV